MKGRPIQSPSRNDAPAGSVPCLADACAHHGVSRDGKAGRPARVGRILAILGLACFPCTFGLASDDISLIAVGDIMLGRYVEDRYRGIIDIPETGQLLRSADIVFGNLESCFGGGEYPDARQPIPLRAPDRSVRVLKDLGFTVISLANNHCTDYGAQAAEETLSLLQSNGIRGFGHRSATFPDSVIIDVKGRKIGFIGYSGHMKCGDGAPLEGGANPLCVDRIVDDVAAIRRKVDVLIASLHWGKEYSDRPVREQIDSAHRLIDSGIDVILGHHLHVIQGIENYRGKLIAYSLGNFLFDQRSPMATKSFALRMMIRNRDLADVEIVPLILDRYLPRPASREEAMEINASVEKLSLELRSDPADAPWRPN